MIAPTENQSSISWLSALLVEWHKSCSDCNQLLAWSAGYDLPPIGDSLEPFRWLADGLLNLDDPERSKVREHLANCAAKLMHEKFSVDDFDWPTCVQSAREKRVGLRNFFGLCAFLKQPLILWEPLRKVYAQRPRENQGFDEEVRFYLASAMINNQNDRSLMKDWLEMIEMDSHDYFPCMGIDGEEGIAECPNTDKTTRTEKKLIEDKLVGVVAKIGRGAQPVRRMNQILGKLEDTSDFLLNHLLTNSATLPGWMLCCAIYLDLRKFLLPDGESIHCEAGTEWSLPTKVCLPLSVVEVLRGGDSAQSEYCFGADKSQLWSLDRFEICDEFSNRLALRLLRPSSPDLSLFKHMFLQGHKSKSDMKQVLVNCMVWAFPHHESCDTSSKHDHLDYAKVDHALSRFKQQKMNIGSY